MGEELFRAILVHSEGMWIGKCDPLKSLDQLLTYDKRINVLIPELAEAIKGLDAASEEQRETIRPAFNPAIMIYFRGTKITSDAAFLLLRNVDERFGIMGPWESELEDARSRLHERTRSASNDSPAGVSNGDRALGPQ